MASTVDGRPVRYRMRAQEARDRAAAEADEEVRNSLLRDAELWDRMADYEEKNPTHVFPTYYPKT